MVEYNQDSFNKELLPKWGCDKTHLNQHSMDTLANLVLESL